MQLIDNINNQNHFNIVSFRTRKFLTEEFAKIKQTDVNEKDLAKLEERYIKYYTRKHTEELSVKRSPRYDFIDLFCGAGGLSCGLEQEGLNPKIAVDKDESSLRTYLFNRPTLNEDQIINSEIENINISKFPKVPLVIGGPPCQGFSNANKQRKENDKRNVLYKFYVKSVKRVSPELFLMENVEGILKFIDIIKEDFADAGYNIHYYILNTRSFGFPQNRKRVYIFGIAKKHLKIQEELKTIWESCIQSSTGTTFTLWDAIGDLPSLDAKSIANSTNIEKREWGYTFSNFSKRKSLYCKLINEQTEEELPLLNHKSKYNNERDVEIYKLLPPGEKISDALPELNPYKSRDHIFADKFFKLKKTEVSKTITAHMYYDCHMYIHPIDARGLTPREAARIQGFPDDYLFLGAPNEWYRQIGNAVSPLLAKKLGFGLKSCLDYIYGEKNEQ